MFGEIHLPKELSAIELDKYLENGWFRMGQSIFTCNFLNFNRQFYSAIWLRHVLEDFYVDNTFKKLKKLNSKFRIEFSEAKVTEDKELLFQKYKMGISFENASSLNMLLFDNKDFTIFNTYEICIYDEFELIAVGFFDIGLHSAEGIVSFYNPAYKKYSLGKYLIYNKIEYCKSIGLSYFYPGYFAPNYPLFDYKLTISKFNIEFYNLFSRKWQSINTFDINNTPLTEMKSKLDIMLKCLHSNGFIAVLLNYEYYNSNNIPHLAGYDLFDYPIFIMILNPTFDNFAPIIVWDTLEQKYSIVKCVSSFFAKDYISDGKYYGTHLMKIQECLFSHVDESLLIQNVFAT